MDKFDILTVFGLGKTRFSATTASIVGIFFYLTINTFASSFYLHSTLFILITVLSGYQLNQKRLYAMSDPKEVVIDEFLGMYIALIIPAATNYLHIFILFFLFRFIDILKPFPVNWIEKKFNNQYGLLIDDIAIGVFLGVGALLLGTI